MVYWITYNSFHCAGDKENHHEQELQRKFGGQLLCPQNVLGNETEVLVSDVDCYRSYQLLSPVRAGPWFPSSNFNASSIKLYSLSIRQGEDTENKLTIFEGRMLDTANSTHTLKIHKNSSKQLIPIMRMWHYYHTVDSAVYASPCEQINFTWPYMTYILLSITVAAWIMFFLQKTKNLLMPVKRILYFMLPLENTMCEQVELSRTSLYKIKVGSANSS